MAAGILIVSAAAQAQPVSDKIISQHVRLRIPVEREWLGRDSIMDLERCWRFVNGATGERLPRKILVVIAWDKQSSFADPDSATVLIGMNDPSASPSLRKFLIHSAAREMARMGLLELARGIADREGIEFLFEGMSEILAREFDHSARSLEGAWVVAHFLDRMKLLGLEAQSRWSEFSGGRQDLWAASPGITFLLTCRELHGRERLVKLFEALRKNSLERSLAIAFKGPAASLESTWLKKARGYNVFENVSRSSDDEVPVLERTEFAPAAGRPGSTLAIKLFLRSGARELPPDEVFVLDEASGRVARARLASERGSIHKVAEIAIEPERKPGQYSYRVTAVDNSGNVGNWVGAYAVER